MIFDVRPQITVFEPLLVAYPIGMWDRQEFLQVRKDLDITVKQIAWYYGLTAYQFETLSVYTTALAYIYSKQAFGRWNK